MKVVEVGLRCLALPSTGHTAVVQAHRGQGVRQAELDIPFWPSFPQAAAQEEAGTRYLWSHVKAAVLAAAHTRRFARVAFSPRSWAVALAEEHILAVHHSQRHDAFEMDYVSHESYFEYLDSQVAAQTEADISRPCYMVGDLCVRGGVFTMSSSSSVGLAG